MRIPRLPFLVLLMVSLQGCVPIQQVDQLPSPVAFHATYAPDDGYVLFAIGEETPSKEYEIVPDHSFVVDPSGVHHPIRVEPYDYDVSRRISFVQDEIYVLRSATDSKPIRLHDGIWRFVLTWRSHDQERQETFPLRIWTLHYNPAVQGWPSK